MPSLGILRVCSVLALGMGLRGGQNATAQEAQRRIQSGDFRGAKEEVTAKLRRAPREVELWNLLGISETELGEMPAAEEAFRRGLALEPRSVSLNENAGLLYFREAKYDKAKRFLEQAVAAGSSQPAVRFSLAEARLRTGEEAQARQELLNLEGQLGGRPEYWDERGRAELPVDAAVAERSFGRALELSPQDLTALNGAATAAEKQGLDEKALAYLLKAGSDNVATLLHLASICIRLDLGPDAIGALERAQRLDPWNFEIVYLLGRANISVGNWQQALGLFQQYARHDPGFAPAYFAMGWLYVRLNRTGEARAQLEHCLRLAPGMTDARYELAQLEFDDGHLDAAERLLAMVLRADPGHARANVAMGDIRLRHGDMAGAKADYRRAIGRDRELAAAHYKLAQLLAREHRTDEASRERQRAAELTAQEKRTSRTQWRLVLPEAPASSSPPVR